MSNAIVKSAASARHAKKGYAMPVKQPDIQRRAADNTRRFLDDDFDKACVRCTDQAAVFFLAHILKPKRPDEFLDCLGARFHDKDIAPPNYFAPGLPRQPLAPANEAKDRGTGFIDYIIEFAHPLADRVRLLPDPNFCDILADLE